MNIFSTYSDPEKSAIVLDDIRANKLILESAQMLSTAIRWHGGGDDTIYRIAHPHHPCSLWTRRSRANFDWLVRHARALISQQGNYHHKCFPIIKQCEKHADVIPDGPLTPFANCAKNNKLGLDFTWLPVHEAYRNYLWYRWEEDTIRLSWNKREKEKERLVSKWKIYL